MPYFKQKPSQKDFVILLFDKIALYEDADEINPIYDTNPKTVARLYSDTKRGIPKELAANVFQHIYRDQFEKFLEDSLNEDLYENLCIAFKLYVSEITIDNLFACITDTFCKILEQEAGKKKTYKKSNIYQLPVEKQICLIFEQLKRLDLGQFTPVKYDSYTIKNKIPNDIILQQKIFNNVAGYYDYINNYLKESELQNTINSTEISNMVSEEFKFQDKRFNSKEDIFNALVNWLSQRTHASVSACEIVISYYVQNCEVFDATSK